MRILTSTVFKLAAIALAGSPVLAPSFANAAYPDRPIRVVVPFAAGSANDVLCRSFLNPLQIILKQPIAIENKPGGNTTIGAMDIARSKPDGYSLMCTGVSTVVVNPLLSKSIPYDVRKDFEPISGIGGAGFFVLVNNANKAKNVKDMVAIAKSAAQPMRVGTLSPLGIIAYGLLQKAMGVELSRVPYSAGYAGLIPDLARGDLDIVIEAIPGAINHVNNNTVSVLGVTTAQRSASAPDLPTFVEQGFDVNISGFTAFFAPAGVPADILATLERASLEALKDQELTKRFEAMATATLPIGGKQVGELITNSTREWAPIVDRLGLKQD